MAEALGAADATALAEAAGWGWLRVAPAAKETPEPIATPATNPITPATFDDIGLPGLRPGFLKSISSRSSPAEPGRPPVAWAAAGS